MSTMETLGYERTRALLLAAGAVVLALTAVATIARGVDVVEVVGVVLFLPVFVAALQGGLRSGALAGAAAGAVYVLLRVQGLQLQTLEAIAPTISLRLLGYLLFGGLGGWAAGVLSGSIDKLARFDTVDSDSELLNARGVHQQLSQELARARRYGSDFAVVSVAFDSGDAPRTTRRAVGRALRGALRTVDDIGRVRDLHGGDRMLAVLPETPAAGAAVVAEKVTGHLRDGLGEHAAAEVRWLTFGQDGPRLDDLLDELDRIVAADFPTA